jgi:CBS domain-containing protein
MARLRSRLEPLRVADVMTLPTAADALVPLDDREVIEPHASAWQAFLELAGRRRRRLAVVDDGRLVGIVSHHDLQEALAGEGAEADSARQAA